MAQPGAWCSYDAKTGRCILYVHVQPNARSSAIVGVHGDALKIRVAAPAVENRANVALLDFLCDQFDLKRSQIEIRRGAHGRRKCIEIATGPDLLPELSLHLARSRA
jgi:uncharacterized protein (TIGR00251 family)